MTLIESKPIARPTDSVGAGGGLPRHVAIIMDGNGRWAAARGLPRVEGHRRGVEAVRRAVRAAGELGIEVLTIYSFSAENWSRPRAEVMALMNLLRRFVREDLADLHASGVRVRIIGEREGLADDLRRLIDHCETLTRDNRKMTLVVAFNYGARQEITSALRRIADGVAKGSILPAEIGPELISANLDTADLPEPDLVIRTSGEKRLSNFLLWQSAYSEFVFLSQHWPEFDRALLEHAIAEYRARERRFGGLSEALPR